LAQYEYLPIYKAAFDLLVYFENRVKNLSRFTSELAENATLLLESFCFMQLHPMLTYLYLCSYRVYSEKQKVTSCSLLLLGVLKTALCLMFASVMSFTR